jgi:hypothetical protein
VENDRERESGYENTYRELFYFFFNILQVIISFYFLKFKF